MSRTDLQPTAPTWAVVSRDSTVQTLTELVAGQTLSTMSRVDPYPTRAEAVAAAQVIDADWQADEPEPKPDTTPRPPTVAERIGALESRLGAVAALAEAASITAQEVAAAAKPTGR